MASACNDRLAGLRLRVLGQIDLAPCNGCDGCGLRCTSGVQMTREEYLAVRAYVADPANRDYVERVAAQDKAVEIAEGVQVTACRFRDLDRGLCAIYPARPLVCRLLGHVEWLPCPIERIARPADTQDALSLMRAYAEQERRTYEEWAEDDTDA